MGSYTLQSGYISCGYENDGKWIDEEGCHLFYKLVEIPENILKDSSAQFSNNLYEYVKLLLKNFMNIGSEAIAENSVFIFSMVERCKLDGINPQDYLKHLFECILYGKDCDKKALCPIFC